MKLTIYNAKGGCSKSTSVVNIGHALALEGKKVLLVDLDPQASLSFHLGVDRGELSPSISGVLLKDKPIAQAIRPTGIKNVDVITSDLSLSNFDIALASAKGREFKLRDALKTVKGYDIILIDPVPSMGLLALNAVCASDHLLVPTLPHHLSLQGLRTLQESLEAIQRGIGACPGIIGYLITQLDRRSRAANEIVNLMRKHYGSHVFDVVIPVNSKIPESSSHGKTIFQHDSNSTGAKAYQALTKELIKKIKQGNK
jgi:chromosome partitioning protein